MTAKRFLDEVAEQPDALRRLIEFYQGDGKPLLAAWRELIGEAEEVLFAGMGTSSFAAGFTLAGYEAEGIVARMAEAGELAFESPIPADIYVLVSQSGRSYETCRMAEQLREEGERFVAMVNDESSPLAEGAELVLPLKAGAENSISAKTYCNTLALLALMCSHFEGIDTGHVEQSLLGIAEHWAKTDAKEIEAAATRLAGVCAISFLSTGGGMTAARQAAITFTEGARLPTAAMTIGAFRHGPIEMAGPEHGVVIFARDGDSLEATHRLAERLDGYGAPVVLISDALDDSHAGPTIHVPRGLDWLYPLACADAHARLLAAVAHRRGLVAGEFRHAQKITDAEL